MQSAQAANVSSLVLSEHSPRPVQLLGFKSKYMMELCITTTHEIDEPWTVSIDIC